MEEIPITYAKLAEYETFTVGFAGGCLLMASAILLFSGNWRFLLPFVGILAVMVSYKLVRS